MNHLNFVSISLGETLCNDEAEWISLNKLNSFLSNLLYWPRNKTIDHLNQKRLSLTLDHFQEEKRPSK